MSRGVVVLLGRFQHLFQSGQILDGMGWEAFTFGTQDIHGFLGFNNHSAFVVGAIGSLYLGRIERQVFGQKAVGNLAFRGAVIMAFLGKMSVFNLTQAVVKAVYALNEGILQPRHLAGPVLAVGNNEQGPGSAHGGDFSVVGTTAAQMDRATTFAG